MVNSEYRWVMLPLYNEYEVDMRPELAGHYGQIPIQFINQVRAVSGLEGWELQDRLDRLMFDLFNSWNLGEFIRLQYAAYAERRKKFARFKKWVTIAIIACVALPAFITAAKASITALTSSHAQALTLLSKVKWAIEVFVINLELSFKSFLTNIYFDTLVGVHKIAMLVSADYRNVMKGLYSEISQVSSALGFGPYFLALALQNTRNLVLDVSTSMGMRYDMAEIQWLSTFHEYLGNFAGATYKYTNDPEAVFFDLTRWVETDALDKKGAFVEALTKTLDHVADTVGEMVDTVVLIRDDLEHLVKDLPDKIRSQVEPYIQPHIERFDDFITETYDPTQIAFERIIGNIQSLQTPKKTNSTV